VDRLAQAAAETVLDDKATCARSFETTGRAGPPWPRRLRDSGLRHLPTRPLHPVNLERPPPRCRAPCSSAADHPAGRNVEAAHVGGVTIGRPRQNAHGSPRWIGAGEDAAGQPRARGGRRDLESDPGVDQRVRRGTPPARIGRGRISRASSTLPPGRSTEHPPERRPRRRLGSGRGDADPARGAEPGTALVSFDQEKWARAMDYGSQSLEGPSLVPRHPAAPGGAETRARRGLGARRDQHRGRPSTLEWIVEHFADHVPYHLRTIAEAPGQYRGAALSRHASDGTPAVGGPRQVRAPRGRRCPAGMGPKKAGSGCS